VPGKRGPGGETSEVYHALRIRSAYGGMFLVHPAPKFYFVWPGNVVAPGEVSNCFSSAWRAKFFCPQPLRAGPGSSWR